MVLGFLGVMLQGCGYNDLSYGEQFIVETVIPEVVEPVYKKMSNDLLPFIEEKMKYSGLEFNENELAHPDWPLVKCYGRVVHINDC